MKMPFGRHRGTDLDDIPDDYLCWCLDNLDLNPTLREAMRRRLGLEPDGDGRTSPAANGAARAPPAEWVPPPPGIDRQKLENAVTAWWRRLARENHPDRGGSHEVMKALSAAYESLKEFLSDLKR